MFDEDNNQVSFVGTDFSYSAIYQVDSNRALVMDIDDFSPIRIPAESSPHIGYVEGILGNAIPIQNILDFEKDFKPFGIKVFKLEQNYRSTEHIVQAANEVINFNTRQIQKKIW